MRIAIIGSGSAAMHHSKAASELGYPNVFISTRNFQHSTKVYQSIELAEYNFKPTHYIVANKTSSHAETLFKIREFNLTVPILCEKPLYGSTFQLSDENVFMGFNLRFNPIIRFSKEIIVDCETKLNSISIEYGRDLSSWRSAGFRLDTYSRFRNQGGGILNDLCHELDFLVHLFGEPNKVIGNGGVFSKITVDAPDLFEIIFQSNTYDIAHIHLNCISPQPFRNLRAFGNNFYFFANLLKNVVYINDRKYHFAEENTFALQLKAFIENPASLPNLNHGIFIDSLVSAIEHSNVAETWVNL